MGALSQDLGQAPEIYFQMKSQRRHHCMTSLLSVVDDRICDKCANGKRGKGYIFTVGYLAACDAYALTGFKCWMSVEEGEEEIIRWYMSDVEIVKKG